MSLKEYYVFVIRLVIRVRVVNILWKRMLKFKFRAKLIKYLRDFGGISNMFRYVNDLRYMFSYVLARCIFCKETQMFT